MIGRLMALAYVIMLSFVYYVIRNDQWPWGEAKRNGLACVVMPTGEQDMICRNIRMELFAKGTNE